ncbi:MAG TPA: plastocyanin/azurin family copper-binding protein [Gaiellales bacterium]|jgi:plastocyanin|nr:plastocyanin/azurin family copper-binding protein [Gaiellales bacterium]
MRYLRLAAGLAALSLAQAACGGGSSSGTSTPAGGRATGGGGGGGTPVNVTEKDFSITIAGGTTLAPGTYTFNVTNEGPSAHNLTIEGPGVEDEATPTFSTGTKQLTVTLKNGTYEFYCSVPGHKQAGMDVNVTVGSGGASGGGSTESSGGGGATESGGGWG